MSNNQNENIVSALQSALKCVCSTPKDMNIFAVVLAESIANSLTNAELLEPLHLLTLRSAALRSYL